MRHRVGTMIACAIIVHLMGGCSKKRPQEAPLECNSWKQDIGPALAADCVSCHGGQQPAAGYDLSSYEGALGDGSDSTPNAQAGNASSLLITKIDPDTADMTHQGFANLYASMQKWVVQCDLRYSDSPIHPAGILDPSSSEFHGQILADNDWNFSLCTRCHGDDFSGGSAGVACTSCHTQGPTACRTCHNENLLADGAHAAHVPAMNGVPDFTACSKCHITPTNYKDPGHLFTATGQPIPPPAKVTFGTLANTTPDPSLRAGPPTFDPDTGTCTNVYCHGAVLGDANAQLTTPGWFHVGQGDAACGTCHGLPPSNHTGGQTQCNICHQRVAGPNRTIANVALHVNGQVEIGRSGTDCSSCHGSMTNPAPPLDLLGNTATTFEGVGAHQGHLQALHRLRGPIACNECHQVPTAVDSAGHIDHPLPAEVTFGSLATSNSATPQWDHASATCTNVYCHGGGVLQTDASPTVDRQPVWTDTTSGPGYACGSCHGIPPQDGVHDPTLTLRDCSNCHAQTVDSYGNIIVTGPPGQETSFHMNGQIDVN